MIKPFNEDKLNAIIKKTINDSSLLSSLLIKHNGDKNKVYTAITETIDDLKKQLNPFLTQPVSAKEFLENPYYLGVDENGIGLTATLHDELKEEFIKVHDNPELEEVVLTGGIGWGKSFFMEISIIYQIYLLSCLKEPAMYFGLAKNSKIAIMIISITQKQAKRNMFSGIKEAIKTIPYFIEKFEYDMKKGDAEALVFPRNIELMNATSEHSSTIGLNIYSAALDEANFFKKVTNSKRANSTGEIYDEAMVLYQSVRRRLDARFMQNGHKPGIFYIGSSKVYPNDFTANHIKKSQELERETGKHKIHVMDYNLWTVNRDRYMPEEFKVFVGGINKRSRIIEEFEVLTPEELRDANIINVPMDFYDRFRSELDDAIRDIAGIAVYTVQPFIGNKEFIGIAFEQGKEIGLERIFSVDEATLSPKREFMTVEYIKPHKIRNKSAIRYVGIDIGLKKDKLGFSMAYIDGYRYIEKEMYDEASNTFKKYKEKEPNIVIELLLTVVKEEEFGEVELSRVRNLIHQLKIYGYKIRHVSLDGYQSADTFQWCQRNNIDGTYISMDKTNEPYETYRSALYQSRVYCAYHPVLELELNELERDYVKNKIDHNPRGCFLGDTNIKLLNGKDVPIKELIGKENVELYGCRKNGKLVPVVATKIWETKKVTKYLRIQLDNGEIIECTPEHKFMLLNGDYIEAQYLKDDMSLMPLYSSFEGKYLNGYERCYDNHYEKWIFTHQLVDKYYNGFEMEFDINRTYKGITEIQKMYGSGLVAIRRRLKSINFDYPMNHKITSITIINSETPIPVYDIEVPETSNFALSAGIFVHNSKDLSDAVGQIVYNIHINPCYNDHLLLPSKLYSEEKKDGMVLKSKEEIITDFLTWAKE